MSASARLIYFKIPVESLYAPEFDFANLVHPLFERAVDGALGVAPGHIAALVIQLFALAQSQLHLHPAVFKVEGKGDQRQALLL